MSETTLHPKAEEAMKAAAEHAARKAANKEFVRDLTEQGVRFAEVQPESDYDRSGRPKLAKHGRMTLAYVQLGRNLVAVSTTVCHPDDNFDKLIGRTIAGHNMAMGHCIVLRKPTSTNMTLRQWLVHKFTEFGE